MKAFFRKHYGSLNELCRQYVRSIACAAGVNLCLRRDPDWLFEKFSSNTIDEELFLKLIGMCASARGSYGFITAIVDVVDDACITDAVFDKLLAIGKKGVRNRICIALSHKHLTEGQLKTLCGLQLCHECFYELVCLCYTDAQISAKSFVDAINTFLGSKFREDLVYLLEELNALKASDETKENLLDRIAQLMDSGSLPSKARIFVNSSGDPPLCIIALNWKGA